MGQLIEYQGSSMTLRGWCRELGLSYLHTVAEYDRGVPLAEIVREDRRRESNTLGDVLLTFEGQCMNMSEWARELDMNYDTLRKRHSRGWAIPRILTEPVAARYREEN